MSSSPFCRSPRRTIRPHPEGEPAALTAGTAGVRKPSQKPSFESLDYFPSTYFASSPARPGWARLAGPRGSAHVSASTLFITVLKAVASLHRRFSRAFRRTAGAAPHHWLMTRRVEAAKEKLRDSRLSLLDVALACGFSDQSHLTRVFAGMVGLSPGAWRRALE